MRQMWIKSSHLKVTRHEVRRITVNIAASSHCQYQCRSRPIVRRSDLGCCADYHRAVSRCRMSSTPGPAITQSISGPAQPASPSNGSLRRTGTSEALVLSVLQCPDHGCEPMTEGVATRVLFAFFLNRTSAPASVGAVGLDLSDRLITCPPFCEPARPCLCIR